MKKILFVGLVVHAETISIAVAEEQGEVRFVGTIPNDAESVRKAMKKLGPSDKLRVCYEAGPCGYVLYWQFVQMAIKCEVIAPTLIPVKAGDRVKTDRRDAEKLARCYRSGDLTAVWVPDEAHQALRDLVRAREAGKKDFLRARNRLQKFLLRHGRRPPKKTTAWTINYWAWLKTVVFAQSAQEATLLDYVNEVHHQSDRVARLDRSIDDAVQTAPGKMRAVIDALQTLRGVAKVTAVTIVAEVGELSRFERPCQLMAYSGAVPSEHSTGGPGKARRGAITKTGNAHLRRVVVEAAWAYQHKPGVYGKLKKRQESQREEIKTIAWKAQLRLCARYRRLTAKGKEKQKVVTAVARELLGFIWAIGVEAERQAA